MNQLTAEQLEQLADWYHARECRQDHNDRCGWHWENTSSYPANATRWAHNEWKQRVPALVERDRQNVDQLLAILGQPPADSLDPLDGFTLGYDRGYIGIGLHCAACTDQAGDIGMSESEALAEIDDGTPLADVIELARTHHQRHTEPNT